MYINNNYWAYYDERSGNSNYNLTTLLEARPTPGGGKVSKKKPVTKHINKRRRRIYTGSRGGKFYISKGKKVYI